MTRKKTQDTDWPLRWRFAGCSHGHTSHLLVIIFTNSATQHKDQCGLWADITYYRKHWVVWAGKTSVLLHVFKQSNIVLTTLFCGMDALLLGTLATRTTGPIKNFSHKKMLWYHLIVNLSFPHQILYCWQLQIPPSCKMYSHSICFYQVLPHCCSRTPELYRTQSSLRYNEGVHLVQLLLTSESTDHFVVIPS